MVHIACGFDFFWIKRPTNFYYKVKSTNKVFYKNSLEFSTLKCVLDAPRNRFHTKNMSILLWVHST